VQGWPALYVHNDWSREKCTTDATNHFPRTDGRLVAALVKHRAVRLDDKNRIAAAREDTKGRQGDLALEV
jgi:hypothetical protein